MLIWWVNHIHLNNVILIPANLSQISSLLQHPVVIVIISSIDNCEDGMCYCGGIMMRSCDGLFNLNEGLSDLV